MYKHPMMMTSRASLCALGAFRGLRGTDIPADPVAPGSPHHQIEVSALEPSQFLGEHGHTLPPGAVHPVIRKNLSALPVAQTFLYSLAASVD